MLKEIDLSRANLNLLLLFSKVYEEGNVGRTATRLNLSPSAVSHGLRRLRLLLNDPLFLKTPRGVIPTDLAVRLAPEINEILSNIRQVFSTARFDPKTSVRRFTIGAPDNVSAVFLPTLLKAVRDVSPGVSVGIRHLMPMLGQPTQDQTWTNVFAELDAHSMDLAVIPTSDVPARFKVRKLYDEDFVVAVRAGHGLAEGMSLREYCAAQHLVVSQAGEPIGFVDVILSQRDLAREVALTVPNSMFALSIVAKTDLVCALPRTFVSQYGAQFGVVIVEPPIPLQVATLNVIVPTSALMDAGIAWILTLLAEFPQS